MTRPDEKSPLFDHGRGLAPRVQVRTSPWTVPLAGLGLLILGGLVFSTLQTARLERQKPKAQASVPISPPPYQAPAPAPIIVAPVQPDLPATPAVAAPNPASPPVADLSLRLKAPAVIVDLSAATPPVPVPSPAPAAGAQQGTDMSRLSAEDRFTTRVLEGSANAAKASRIGDLSTTAVQGTVIPAVLETAINSSLPGFIRGVVTRDVRGFDGTRILIPRGSKLIGQYHAGVALGQSRAFVVWSRLVTPEGVSVDVGSPGTDPMGRGGIEGETDNQFFRRFGGSILLSVLSAALDSASGRGSSSTAIVIGSNTQASSIAQIALQKQIDIAPIIRIPQGEPIRVFLVRDLDFSKISGLDVTPASKPQ